MLAFGVNALFRVDLSDQMIAYLASLGLYRWLSVVGGYLVAVTLFTLIESYLTLKLMSCAVITATLQALRGEEPDLLSAYRIPLPVYLSVVAAAIIETLLIFGPAVLLAVLLVWLNVPAVTIVWSVGLGLNFWLVLVSFFTRLAMVAIVAERTDPLQGLLRSARLVWKNWGQVLMVISILAALQMLTGGSSSQVVVGILLQIVWQFAVSAGETTLLPWLGLFSLGFLLLSSLVNILWIVFQAALYTALYWGITDKERAQPASSGLSRDAAHVPG